MAAPFYLVFIPVALVFGSFLFGLYAILSHDKDSELNPRKKEMEEAERLHREGHVTSDKHA